MVYTTTKRVVIKGNTYIGVFGSNTPDPKAIMQIVYSAWYAYEHDNITEDFVMIEGSFV